MQDPSAFKVQPMNPHFPEQEQLKCPRCDSKNTKVCYYNNYNLSQPRHFCKNCKRYWKKGGTLRNIPVGGGTRKTKKLSTSTTSKCSKTSSRTPQPGPTHIHVNAVEQRQRVSESFSSLLAPNGCFGNLFVGLNSSGSSLKMV